MVFSMRSSKKADRAAKVGAQCLAVMVAAFLAVTLAGKAQASGFNVRNAEIQLIAGVYLLDADLELSFSPEALEALNSGVALTVVVELKIVRVRPYVWDKKIAKLEAKQRLRVHDLSAQYIVENLNSGASRAFRTLPRALDALGMLESFPMLDEYLLEPGQSYDLKLRARLDIESLPAPLRPVAYLSSFWRQESEWSTWSIER